MLLNMTKIIPILLLFLIIFIPFFAFGDEPDTPIIGGTDDVIEIINNFASFLWIIFTAVTVIFFIIAGITFLTAAGDPTKFEKAKKMVFYGVIGLSVALLAGGMQELIESLLTESPPEEALIIVLNHLLS